RSDRPVMPLGLPLGTAMTSWLRTNVVGVPSALPASVTVFMFVGAAEANTSAGAPWLICVARVELLARLKVTFAPGVAASESSPILVNDAVSDAAANTVTVPVTPALLGAPAGGLAVFEPPPHPARPTTVSVTNPASVVRIHRALTSLSFLYRQRWWRLARSTTT